MTNDDPSFAEGETPAESTAAGTAGPGQLERLSAQALAYRPEARTYLREAEWAEWAEYLVPYALGAAMDSSDPRRLRLLLSMVAGLLDYCLAEGIANTAHPERVLRESSIDRYLVKLKGDGTLGTTLTQTKWALSKVAAATPQTPLMLGPGVAGDGLAPQATSSASTQSGKASGKYALLTTQGDGEPNPADLWAAYEPQYWAVLAAIRDQVLAQHPNAHAVVSRPTGVALPLGDVEVARLLAAAELAGGRRRTTRASVRAYLCLGLGAGLRISEQYGVRGTDVTCQPDGTVSVTVTEMNRPGFDGGSGYWISTRVWSVRFVA